MNYSSSFVLVLHPLLFSLIDHTLTPSCLLSPLSRSLPPFSLLSFSLPLPLPLSPSPSLSPSPQASGSIFSCIALQSQTSRISRTPHFPPHPSHHHKHILTSHTLPHCMYISVESTAVEFPGSHQLPWQREG